MILSNDRVFIAGITGTGKTTLAKQIVSGFPKYLIIDPEWTYGELGKVVHKLSDLKNIDAAKVVYQTTDPSNAIEFDALCTLAMTGKNYMVLIDEVHLYTTSHTIPNALKNLIVQGRKRGIGCIMISQRPQLTNSTCISQAQHVIAFNLFHPRDVEFFKGFIPNCDEIIKLPKFHYIYMDVSSSKLIKGVTKWN